jgi:hypothetical protein
VEFWWWSERLRLDDRRVSDAAARMQGHDAYDLIEEQFNSDGTMESRGLNGEKVLRRHAPAVPTM